MVQLASMGFLQKAHSSAGRIPTSLGLKFYVKQLMKTQEVSVADEVSMKEKIWDYRNQLHRLLREATKNLAAKTKTIAVATTQDGDLFAAGTAYILDMPEFYDIDVTRSFLSLLDRYEIIQGLCEKAFVDEETHVLIGEDMGSWATAPYGFVFSQFTIAGKHGTIGVLGPARMNYQYVIPTVKTYSDLIAEISPGW
jgi:heat-inducible transcriptional repressor